MKINMPLLLIILTVLCGHSVLGKVCTDKLNKQFEDLPAWLNQEDNKTEFDTSCVKHSMDAFAGWARSLGYDEDGKKGVFIYCSEESNDDYQRSSIPQCQTDAYVKTTLNSYMSVADCLGVNFENLYPIIAAESGFYHNSFSPSGMDFGFGQVTDPAIHDVNISWHRFVDEMKDSDKKSCKNIISFIEDKNLNPIDSDYHCELTRAPKNPLLNVIYTGMHYRLISSYMEMYSKRSYMRSRLEEFLGNTFSQKRYQKIKDVLIMLSYNLGHDGTVMAFEEFFLEKAYKLEQLQILKKDLSAELGKVNFALMELETIDLREKKEFLLSQLNQVRNKIVAARNPRMFNGDESQEGSFGAFIVEKKISYYLKILRRRVNYISKKDSANLCPSESIFNIAD